EAKEHLGMKHVEFDGTRAVDRTVDPLMCSEVGIGARQEKILAWMAKRNWDVAKQGSILPNLYTRDKATKQFTLEDRLADWGPKVEKAIRDQEQRTGRKWDRVYGPIRKQEPEGLKTIARVEKPEPVKVAEPKPEDAKEKIYIKTYYKDKEIKMNST